MIATTLRIGLSRKIRKECTRSLILGIESSCDDSATAIINPETKELVAEYISSQPSFKIGGVLPTIAMKGHAIGVPKAVDNVLEKVDMKEIKAIAVTNQPGLRGSLVIGLHYAQYLCTKHQKPMIPIHHMEAHALTPRFTDSVDFPYMVLLISGGHCILAMAQDIDRFVILGETIDMSPGELIDKAARKMRLHTRKEFKNLSGGKAIEILGKDGNPFKFNPTEPLTRERNCLFSFAGMYTAFALIIDKLLELPENEQIQMSKDICASLEFQLGKHLVRRLMRGIDFARIDHWPEGHKGQIVLSGGVASNLRIRNMISQVCQEFDCEAIFPPLKYCTDNGVMIAWNGVEKWIRQKDIIPPEKVFQVEANPRMPLGIDISRDVENCKIMSSKIKFKF